MEAAVTFGRRLGHLIATLTAPEHEEKDVSEWRAAYLRYWSDIREVWLGGGLAAALGVHLVEAARLRSGVRVEMAHDPGVLALIGLARTRPYGTAPRVVLDFGHSLVKRGVAFYSGGRLQHLHRLPPIMAPVTAAIVEFVVDIVAETLTIARHGYGDPDGVVRVSIASYVRDGRPYDTRSLYAPVTADAIAHAAGIDVQLEHDGTSAARGVVPTAAAAVILLGTSLGIGFAPPAQTLIPLADRFSVVD